MQPVVQFENVTKAYGHAIAVADLNLSIEPGKFVTLLGPSGCGKSTTLRMLGGFEIPNSGRIRLSGSDVTQLPPNKRNVNIVFQDYALFPHMNVARNIAFGLELKGMDSAAIHKRVMELLALVQREIPPRVPLASALRNGNTPVQAGVGSTAKHFTPIIEPRRTAPRLAFAESAHRNAVALPSSAPRASSKIVEVSYALADWKALEGGALSAGLYEPYAVQSIAIEGAKPHPTTLVQSAAMASVADTALIPLQDILGLGSEARMNAPGRNEGNWRWRFRWEQLTDAQVARVREMVRMYDR